MATIKKRMPKDPNKLAARIVELGTGQPTKKRLTTATRRKRKGEG